MLELLTSNLLMIFLNDLIHTTLSMLIFIIPYVPTFPPWYYQAQTVILGISVE